MSLVAAACGKAGAPASAPLGSAAGGPVPARAVAGSAARATGSGAATAGSAGDGSSGAATSGSVAAALPPHTRYATLAEALRATIPGDARVLGFGELHARVDRAQARSALAAFTEALPAFGERISDLVVETWIVDKKCGQQAVTATRKIEGEVKRPEATKSEIALLVDTAQAAQIRPHAMTLSCKDYERLAPNKGPADPIAMLGLVTRELTRIATSAVQHRDQEPGHRPWIAVYGGALHNDRFPDKSVAEWSYAGSVDVASRGHYVEVDLIVPEFAEAEPSLQAQPWRPLLAAADRVRVWARGERSFVVILPRSQPAHPTPTSQQPPAQPQPAPTPKQAQAQPPKQAPAPASKQTPKQAQSLQQQPAPAPVQP